MAEHAADPKAEWEKSEAYFIKLGEKKKFDLRIKLWLFKISYEKSVSDLMNQQDTVLRGFKSLVENEKLKKLLGAILKFGNCLNAGNKSRGQADGFSLGNLGTSLTLKDANGSSMLKLCCLKLVEDDPTFI